MLHSRAIGWKLVGLRPEFLNWANRLIALVRISTRQLLNSMVELASVSWKFKCCAKKPRLLFRLQVLYPGNNYLDRVLGGKSYAHDNVVTG